MVHKKFISKSTNVFDNKIITSKTKQLPIKENIVNNDFTTFFATGLNVYDLIADEKALINALEKLVIVHSKENGGCGKRVFLRFEQHQYRFYCGCGMLLIYPPRSDRKNALLLKWIPKENFVPQYKKKQGD